MFSTRSHSIIRQLAVLAVVFPVTTAVAQHRPLQSLSGAGGATLLLGFGLGNDFIAFDLRAERRLGAGARTPNGALAFGNTISVMARFRPDFRRRIVPK